MEDSFFLFPILLILTILILNVGKRMKSKKITKNLPPGPWKLPIFGSIHHLIGYIPPHRMRELSQKYGPIMHLQLGEISTIVVSSKETVKEVMKTKDLTFCQRPSSPGVEIMTYGCTNIAFAPYGEYWRQLRKICTLELLSAKRVKSFQSTREEEVSNLIKNISINTGSIINLTDEILSMTYNIISRAAFGDKFQEQKEYIKYIKYVMRSAESFSVTNLFPSQHWLHVITGVIHKAKKVHRIGDNILETLINRAKTETGGDDGSFLSSLLNLNDPDSNQFHLTTNNIKSVIQDIIFGGSDTSSTTLDWAFSEMMKTPRVLKKAQAEVRQVFGAKGYVDETSLQELKFLKAVIKETLRMHPASPLLLPRECNETCEINGYTIPAGTQVLVNVWAVGRDQNYWNEGEKFYPERFMDCTIDFKGSNFEYLPFGAGRRICPGISFAEPNLELTLAQLLYHFNWELPFGTSHEDFDMTEAFGVTLKRKSDLFLIPVLFDPKTLE